MVAPLPRSVVAAGGSATRGSYFSASAAGPGPGPSPGGDEAATPALGAGDRDGGASTAAAGAESEAEGGPPDDDVARHNHFRVFCTAHATQKEAKVGAGLLRCPAGALFGHYPTPDCREFLLPSACSAGALRWSCSPAALSSLSSPRGGPTALLPTAGPVSSYNLRKVPVLW